MRVAAIDIGTNTVRLLIADKTRSGLSDVERRLEVVGLGSGVDATGVLSEEAIERTLAALRGFADSVAEHDVSRVRAVATSATRDAGNAPDFLDRATRALGVRPEVISGDEEARLSYTGAMAGSSAAGSAIVIDVGGGSTEFVAGEGEEVVYSVSVNLGSVRLSDRVLQDRPVDEVRLAEARRHAAAHFRALGLVDVDRVIGVAGTFTSLAGIHLGRPQYDRELVHGHTLTQIDLDDMVEAIAPLPIDEIEALPSLHPKRAPVILGGAIVAAEALRATGHAKAVVSESDLLDGLAASV